ncbi:hypothetical protein ACIOC1_28815 [Streptomyces sp. NPDC088197]|uniref:hypothetical protein n=1 Tax=Streptomyces sp. NPDC088197 TaxID=3365840 RepID=UPI0038207046
MVKLAASAYLPPREADRPVLDVSWTFSVGRLPGSDELAARMTRAALDTLGGPYGGIGALITDATSLACAYLVAHSLARRYRVTLGVDGAHCAVAVTDYGYDHGLPGDGAEPVPVPEPARDEARDLCRRLAGAAAHPVTIDGVQVHHAVDGAVLIRFRAQLPHAPTVPPTPPAAPDASRSPGARG